ncbi:peptidoglycan-recognition protein 1-like [Onthophagus taurus]|uniref:peptidoglycan-recognition protein 1-like n=1 Tax=Onthophagus taurus TaxID=166361 RepID=UPI0039BE4AF8
MSSNSFLLLNIFIYVVGTGAFCPYIITRKEWEAGPNEAKPMGTYPMTHVIVHHSNTPICLTKDDCMTVVKSLQLRHRAVNRWPDIGYNFLVAQDGNIYEGIGWHHSSEIVPRYDSYSIHVAVIGDYTSSLPNDKALKALKDFIYCAVKRGSLHENYRLLGHRQLASKKCPGKEFYQELRNWPQWSSY